MKPIRVLITDDHKLVIDGLKAMIQGISELDFVGECRSGIETLKFLEYIKTDVALMDIDMPEMNGIEATKKIKQLYPGIKVLILTMHDEKSMIENLMEIGADGYILKNSDRKELIKAINSVHSGNKYFSDDVIQALNRKEDTIGLNSNNLDMLTEREIEIIKLVCEGLSNKEIGEQLDISHRTVDTHRNNILKKIEANNTAGLIRFAMKNGLISG
jgi:two-component system, NarL family, nitrate/nitrite response regulator NarL